MRRGEPMTANTTTTQLEPNIRARLGALRWRIRAYVWIEGLALIVAWIGLMFWIGFALDYVPVLLGFYLPSVLGLDEMSRIERLVLLGVVGAVAAWIFYRWILRRAFVRLADHSMAVLLERQFGEDHDSLLTVVEMSEEPAHALDFNSEMLRSTSVAATSQLQHVQMRRVFRHVPLWGSLILAMLVVCSIMAFSWTARETFGTLSSRLYGLTDDLYKRRARLEVTGVEVAQTMWVPAVDGADAAGTTADSPAASPFVKRRISRFKPFEDRSVKVARGSSPRLVARADLLFDVVPEACKLQYWTDDGYSDLVAMERPTRSDRKGFRYFSYRNRPLQGIRSNVRFEIMGGDHRVAGYTIQVVDSPSIVSAQLHCQRPAYTELLPQTIEYVPGIQLPMGTRIKIDASTNKPLQRVQLYDPATAAMTYLTREQLAGNRFSHQVDRLDGDLGLEIFLEDVDGVTMDEPYRLMVTAVEDLPPNVKVTLRGIGSSITPDARLPAEGIIGDDYGVAEANVELNIGDDPVPFRFPVELAQDGTATAAVDLRKARAREKDPLTLKPGEKVLVAIRAKDKCDLRDEPNVGSSERYQLDIVTPAELLARLDAREIAQRQRFEQILEEMTKTRGDLVRVQVDLTAGEEKSSGAEPEDKAADASAAEPDDQPLDEMTVRERARSLRLLLVQRAILQTDKSAQEMAGVAATFVEIRDELINNRVDTEERKIRLQEQIIAPLNQIADAMCQELVRRLQALEVDLEQPAGPSLAANTVEQIDLLLLEMQKVLSQMLDLESYNELVEIVRELVKEQEEVLEKTKEERKRRVFGDLLE